MKTVAIVGFAPSYVDAPFADPAIQIWTMNYHHDSVLRTDRIFDLHRLDVLVKEGGVASLAQQTVPVYMQQHYPEIPSSIPYPLAEMTDAYRLPNTEKPYFTSTVSYMLALAIAEGFDEIQMFGIDLAQDTEYAMQRPSCEFFLGVAFGRGIRIVPHRTSDLLKTLFLYGYEDTRREWFADKLQARLEYLRQHEAIHRGKIAEHTEALNQFSGALQDIEHIMKVWG